MDLIFRFFFEVAVNNLDPRAILPFLIGKNGAGNEVVENFFILDPSAFCFVFF